MVSKPATQLGGTSVLPHLSEVPAHIIGDNPAAAGLIHLKAGQLVALLIVAVLGPLMVMIAWLIRRDGGTAIYEHYRVGCGGRLFRCFKFRTMRPDAEAVLAELLEHNPSLRQEWLQDQKLTNDPRVTPLGRWLRRFSLDELPQLLNVLRGEMALVGPRPVTVPELRRYGPTRWHYLSVLPGMTGLWQVSGRSSTGYQRRVELDEFYVKNRSAWLDCKILARTAVVVLTREGAR
jgi:exopolysaccharide production protein ExoY